MFHIKDTSNRSQSPLVCATVRKRLGTSTRDKTGKLGEEKDNTEKETILLHYTHSRYTITARAAKYSNVPQERR
jgi:hypothetical protein